MTFFDFPRSFSAMFSASLQIIWLENEYHLELYAVQGSNTKVVGSAADSGEK